MSLFIWLVSYRIVIPVELLGGYECVFPCANHVETGECMQITDERRFGERAFFTEFQCNVV